jgi:hypothetical protein
MESHQIQYTYILRNDASVASVMTVVISAAQKLIIITT